MGTMSNRMHKKPTNVSAIMQILFPLSANKLQQIIISFTNMLLPFVNLYPYVEIIMNTIKTKQHNNKNSTTNNH